MAGGLGEGLFFGGVASAREKELGRAATEKISTRSEKRLDRRLDFDISTADRKFAKSELDKGLKNLNSLIKFRVKATEEGGSDAKLAEFDNFVEERALQLGGTRLSKSVMKRLNAFSKAAVVKPKKGIKASEAVNRRILEVGIENLTDKELDFIAQRSKFDPFTTDTIDKIRATRKAEEANGQQQTSVSPQVPISGAELLPPPPVVPTGPPLPIESFPSAPVPIPTQVPAAPAGLPPAPIAPIGAGALGSAFIPPPDAKRATNPTTGEVIFILPDGSILDANGALIQGGAQGAPAAPIRGLGQ